MSLDLSTLFSGKKSTYIIIDISYIRSPVFLAIRHNYKYTRFSPYLVQPYLYG